MNKESETKIGRSSILEERASSTNFNPLEWSKCLYEIRQQLFKGSSGAEAYEDCHQHYEKIRRESLNSAST